MKRIALTLICWMVTALAAAAHCSGVDLRAGLTPDERAALESRVDAIPYAEGNHWTATRGNQVLHLVGTVHMADARLDPIVERLRPVMQRADLLLLEMTADGKDRFERTMIEQPDRVFLTSGPTLPDLLAEDEWQGLAEAARHRGIPPFFAAKFQPWYLALVLAIPPCIIEQQIAGTVGLDQRLMDIADALGVPQRPLEPFDTLFTLFGADPIEDQLDVLRLGALPEDVARDAMVTLFAAYFEEKPAEIIEFSRTLAYRHIDMPQSAVDDMLDDMNASLLNRRNHDWIDIITTVPDGVTVVAFGAGHLVGEDGILNLLGKAGYVLERQPF
jgi:uncharacterized protein YbaP (TraB family)